MQAGTLRHRITIQRKNEVRDSFGQAVETFANIATVWASIEPLSGRESFLAQQVNAEVTHRIRMRYYPLEATMRLKYQDRYFEIKTILDREERKRELEVLCQEIIE